MNNKHSGLEKAEKIFSIISSFCIIGGIIIALIQYNLSASSEKRERAIETINRTYNSEFLKSLTNLKGCEKIDNDGLNNDMNLVFNTYYIISIIYNNNIADNTIINKAIMSGVIDFIGLDVYRDKKGWDLEKAEIEKMTDNTNSKN